MPNYVTTAGDTWDTISRKNTGTGSEAATIQAANPGKVSPFAAGVALVIPSLIRPKKPPVTSSDSQDVAISIGGNRFRGWTALQVVRSVDTVDAVSFTAPFEPDLLEFRDTFRPMSFQPVEIYVGDSVLFSGTLMIPLPAYGPNGGTVSVSAYATAGVLMDCPPPASALPVQFIDKNLEEIAATLCEPFGIDVQFEADPGAPFRRVKTEIEATVWSTLTGLAQQRGLVMSSSPWGSLLVRRVDTGQTPVAVLKGDASPVSVVTPELDAQTYYSHITGFRGTKVGRPGLRETAQNTLLLDTLRPNNFNADDIKKAELGAAVSAKIGRMFGAAVSYTVDVNTWRDPAGNLWEPGKAVSLVAPRAMVYQPYDFILRSVRLDKRAGEEKATLSLTLPGAFSGELPKRLPWDE